MSAIELHRSKIEDRAVGMAEALAVEDENFAALWNDSNRSLDFLHGVRVGAMAAIEQVSELGGAGDH